jgi:aminoglycoside phosphotransferase (APT) family kinase protein
MSDCVQVKTCNTAYEELVAATLHRELGCDVKLAPVPTYPDTIVYEVVTDAGRWIFKAMEPDGRDRDGIALEAWSCARAREAGVPTPLIHSLDTSGSRFPSSFLVMEKAAGDSLERLALPRADLHAALKELGSHMRALHEIEIPDFGWLDEKDYRCTGLVKGSAETWHEALFGDIPESLGYLTRLALLTADELDRAHAILERDAPVADPGTTGRLLHGDFGLVHVWFDPETARISSLIDFGERMSGDPVYDFCDLDLEPNLFNLVVAGYYNGTPPPERFDERVWRYAFLRAIPWAAKWHGRGHLQVIDWVRHLLRSDTVPE